MNYHLSPKLRDFEKRICSQNGEDGVIETIFSAIPPSNRFFVEFGVGPRKRGDYSRGLEGNCVLLKRRGWAGLFMDGGRHPPVFRVQQEFITADNVNELFRKYAVPEDLAIVSIDVDGQDYWIWKALEYRPQVVVIEFNPIFGPNQSLVMPYQPDFVWDSTQYFGASLRALSNLGRSKGYRLVFANPVNAFFVLETYLQNREDFQFERLFVQASYHRPDPYGRPYEWAP